MTDFFRIDANVINDARMIEAGADVGGPQQADPLALYVTAWALNRQRGQTGLLLQKHLLLTCERNFSWELARFQRALSALLAAGLLLEPTPGSIQLSDWSDFWYCGLSSNERSVRSRATGGAVASPQTHATGGAVASDSQTVSQSDRPTHPPTGVQGRVGGGAPPEELGQQLLGRLTEYGILGRSPAKRTELANRLASEGCSVFDLNDLWQESQNGDNPGAVMASFLLEPGGWKRILEEARAKIRDDKGRDQEPEDYPSTDVRSKTILPEPVYAGLCPICHCVQEGTHGVHHGPPGWRPGDAIGFNGEVLKAKRKGNS